MFKFPGELKSRVVKNEGDVAETNKTPSKPCFNSKHIVWYRFAVSSGLYLKKTCSTLTQSDEPSF